MFRTSTLLLLFIMPVILSCESYEELPDKETFITPLGKTYSIPEPNEVLKQKYEGAKAGYEADPDNIDNIIWYGRRTAYLGQYQAAIDIYSEGIAKYPDEPRFYRHRGHRYISVRDFDAAIRDLEKAAVLIRDAPNKVEQDGLPNALNIPVSTLHGNIWYHLGLAYYLTHQYDKAYEAYLRCRESGSRYDNIVSSTHWLYMINSRRGDKFNSDSILAPITLDSTVIENHSYRDLCNLYKGLVTIDSIDTGNEDNPSNDAIRYGVANWYFYGGDSTRAREMMKGILDGTSYSSFGYIAAESDWMNYFVK